MNKLLCERDPAAFTIRELETQDQTGGPSLGLCGREQDRSTTGFVSCLPLPFLFDRFLFDFRANFSLIRRERLYCKFDLLAQA